MRNTWPQTTLAIFVLRLALLLLLTLGRGAESLAQGGKPNRSSPLNVTSTVHDYTDSTNSVQNLLRSDDYDATGQASYATVGNVRSQIFSMWYLDLTSQTARSVYLTFSEWVSGRNDPLPDGLYYAEVLSRCFDTNGNIIDFLTVNSSDNRCSLRVDFTHGGSSICVRHESGTPVCRHGLGNGGLQQCFFRHMRELDDHSHACQSRS